MKRLALLCLSGFLLGGLGCASVDSPVAIGEKPVTLTPADWNGTWLANSGALVARVVDPKKGTIEVAWVEKDKNKDELVMRKHTVQIRQTGRWVFVNVPNPDSSNRFIWGRLKTNKREVTIWSTDIDKIKALVKNGTLPGTIDKGDVHLGKLSADQMKRLTSDDKGLLYNWENPLFFQKWSD